MKKGGRIFSAFGLAQFVTILAVGAALWLAYEPWRWERLNQEIRRRFPEVPRITPAELFDWRSKDVLQPVLLDARSESEYDVSHLPGALRAETGATRLGLEGRLHQPIVVYCSVGFDSAPVALRYLAQGYKRVQFLEGGIYLWANQGRPLENLRGPTDKVLPGGGQHLSFLARAHRAK